MVKTRSCKKKEVKPSSVIKGKVKKVQPQKLPIEIEPVPIPSPHSEILIDVNVNEEEEIFEDVDDGTVSPVLETEVNFGPKYILERISILRIKYAENLATGNCAGVHPNYNSSGTLEQHLRGIILDQIIVFTEWLIQTGSFWTYRNLMYKIQGELTNLKSLIEKIWPQIRPNVRLIEKLLGIPRNSLPFFGRPQGFLAIGIDVDLAVDGRSIGSRGQQVGIPFGEKAVLELGKFTTTAKQIVLVEAHAELDSLIDEGKILERAKNSILLTGCGMADLGFCLFLSKLARDTGLPVHFIVDCDFPGFLIAARIAFGTFSDEFRDSPKFLTPNIKPLGILPHQILDTDIHFTEIGGHETEMGMKTLKNKWESHRIELNEENQFWLEIVEGFKETGKKMSMSQFGQNRGYSFIADQIVEAEDKCLLE